MSRAPSSPMTAPTDALIEKLRGLLTKATPGPWESDTIKSEGEYGSGPDTTVGFSTYAIFAEHPAGSNKWLTLFDALNSDAAEIVEDYPDEDGHVDARDAVAEANAALIVEAINALPSLLARIEAAEKVISELTAWLTAAVECEDFAWSPDQQEAAEYALRAAAQWQAGQEGEG